MVFSVIVIQRVRVRWRGRGAPQANARRGRNRPVTLPDALPTGDVVLHDVLSDEADGYARHDDVRAGGVDLARDLALWLSVDDAGSVTVGRMPGRAAYPRARPAPRLFTLAPGQVGRYRANFRFSGYSTSWYYEDWLIHVSNGGVEQRRFVGAEPDRQVDERAHLYG